MIRDTGFPPVCGSEGTSVLISEMTRCRPMMWDQYFPPDKCPGILLQQEMMTHPMRQVHILSLVLFCVAFILQGCGGSGAGASVSGVVTLDGQPARNLVVTFHREGGGVSSGVTDERGAYHLRSSVQQSGTAPGKYRVSIEPLPPGDDADPKEFVEVKIPARYHQESELSAEVTPGSNVFNFALESK